MTLHGRVENGVVVFDNGATLPDGTPVQVTPMPDQASNASAVIAAMESEPHLTSDDIAELDRAIAAGKRPAAAIDPFPKDAPGLP
jgi:hypothetical protein